MEILSSPKGSTVLIASSCCSVQILSSQLFPWTTLRISSVSESSFSREPAICARVTATTTSPQSRTVISLRLSVIAVRSLRKL